MFSDPQKNIEQFNLTPGERVADLGCGSGHYAFAAARAVGGTGAVYVVDIMKDMLQKLKNEARRQNLLNIETFWGDIEKVGGTSLHDATVNAVIIANTVFQLENKSDLPKEVKRILKPNGKVLVVDWKDSFGGMGPQKESIFPPDEAKKLFAHSGFIFEKEIRAGEHHYGLVFRKN